MMSPKVNVNVLESLGCPITRLIIDLAYEWCQGILFTVQSGLPSNEEEKDENKGQRDRDELRTIR